MGASTHQKHTAAWALTRRQHAIISREQLIELGFTPKAIEHRIRIGRLHPKRRGVYAVGRPDLTRRGEWMAAVLSCGPGAALSHSAAAALWGLRADDGRIDVTLPPGLTRKPPGIVIHRAVREVTRRDWIPVTTPVCTLIDLAGSLDPDDLEAAINEADKRDVIDPETLRRALDRRTGRHGVAKLRRVLDRRTFTLTDSKLERRFLPLARRAGLPKPLTGVRLSGFKVDFYWPDLGLVVETDGLRYAIGYATRPMPRPD